jgi:hypothetical protein
VLEVPLRFHQWNVKYGIILVKEAMMEIPTIPRYKYIFQIIDWLSYDDARIIVYNRRRQPGTIAREYKYSRKRKTMIRNIMYKLYKQGYADPDFTMGMTWGIYPEHRDEDPTLTQAEEWPYK